MDNLTLCCCSLLCCIGISYMKAVVSLSGKDNNDVSLDPFSPQGSISFSIPKCYSAADGSLLPLVFRWKFLTTVSRKTSVGRKTYKTCLGVYQCNNCNYLEAPRASKERKKFATPMPPKGPCPICLPNAVVSISRC